VAILPILTMFWIAQSQYWNVYNLWARDHVDLVVLGWQMPVAWVQSLSGLSAVLPVPLVLAFWRWLHARKLEPDDAGKLAMGCLIFACFVVWDASGTLLFGLHRDIPLLWIVISNFGLSFGYLHVQPVAIALFARVAPRSVNAMMVGVYFLSIFAGSILSGRLGGFYERWTPTNFWLLHAAIVGGAGLIFIAFAPLIRRGLAETPPHVLTEEEVPQTGLGL
jgi:POT family proton-dependent oligopeptide transporter